MKFNYRYELLDWLETDTEKTTFSARDLSNGQSVLVHVLPAIGGTGRSSVVERARKKWFESPPDISSAVVDVAEYRGAIYVVTTGLSEFTKLREWFADVQTSSSIERNLEPISAIRVQQPEREPGEFTIMFGGHQQPLPTANESQNGAAPSTERSESVGDFTRAFGIPDRQRVSEQAASVPLATANADELPAKAVNESKAVNSDRDRLEARGQFTIPDISPPANEPARTPPKNSGASAIGFENPPPAPVADSGARTLNQYGTEEGGFTKFFYTPKTSGDRAPREDPVSVAWRPVSPPKPAEDSAGDLNTTDWVPRMRFPESDEEEIIERPVMLAPAPRPTPIADGPGDFTRIIETPQQRPGPPATGSTPAPDTSPSKAASEKAPYLKLAIIILSTLLLVAVIIVLYIVSKK